jgi:hypothetical protein
VEQVNKLLSELERVLEREKKISDVKHILQVLVNEGVLEERALREDITFDEYEARAYIVPASAYDWTHGFAPSVASKMISLKRYIGANALHLWVEAPEKPLPPSTEDIFSEARAKLERLGFTVSTWREGSKCCLEARNKIMEHGTAVAYLKTIDYLYDLESAGKF